MTFEDVLAATGFQGVTTREFHETHVWTLSRLLGYLHSTSPFSTHVLGKRVADFDADFRQALLGFDDSGEYTENARFGYLLESRGEG